MSELSDFINRHTNTYVTCSCGKKCFLSIFIGCGYFIKISAKCYNCNKGMELTKDTASLDNTVFDLAEQLIDEFGKRFNKGEMEK